MESKLRTFFFSLVIIAIAVAAWVGTNRSHLQALANDRNHEPSAQGAHFHITAADGTKTVRQLILEEDEGPQPGNGVVCRLYIANSANHAAVALPTIAGHDPDFEFGIGPGQTFDFPLTKEQDVALDEIPMRTDGVANTYIYWEFCDKR